MAELTNRYYQNNTTNRVIFEEFIAGLPENFARPWLTLLASTIATLDSTQLANYRAWMPIRVVWNTPSVDDRTLAWNNAWLTTINFVATTTNLAQTCETLIALPIWDITYTSEWVSTYTENENLLTEYNDQLARQRYDVRWGVADTWEEGLVIEDSSDDSKARFLDITS